MRHLLTFLFAFAALVSATSAQTVVTDIGSGPAPVDSLPAFFHPLGNQTLFVTREESTQRLWSSDGTGAGTQLLHEWVEDAPFWGWTPFAELAGELIFLEGTWLTGLELWKTDGTVLGTVKLKDMQSGGLPALTGPVLSSTSGFLELGGVLYFNAFDATAGVELWRTDGTSAGTYLAVDLEPGSAGSDPHDAIVHGGAMYFFASNGPGKQGLYRSDGTGAGTSLVQSFDWPLNGGSPYQAPPGYTANLGANFYFYAGEVSTGYELWRSDGTTAGTMLFADLNPNGDSNPVWMTDVGGLLYFVADTGAKPGNSLFRTDGTTAGTIELYTGPVSSIAQTGSGQLSFVTSTSSTGSNTELWTTDGSIAGTHFYMPGPGFWPTSFFAWPAFTTFSTMNPSGTWSLWRTDGTGPGTVELAEFASLPWYGGVGAGAEYWFGGATAVEGVEPWRSDGTSAGTQLVANLAPDLTSDSNPKGTIRAGDEAFFVARPDDKYELFVTDGTASGTQSLTPLDLSYWGNLDGASLQGELIFAGQLPREVWKSDGTPAGTQLLFDVGSPGYPAESVYDFRGAGDRVFFTTRTGQDRTPWVTDGTAVGTFELASVEPGQQSAVFDSLFYFDGDDGVEGREPWVSDGTTAGTQVLHDIESGPNGSYPRRFTQLGSKVYFTASTGQYGTEVWWTEGLGGATQMAFELAPGPEGDIRGLAAAGGKLFILSLAPGFPVLPGNDHGQLWVSDGTQAGTSLIATFPTSTMPSSWTLNEGLFAAGDRVYFYVGAGLWTSDGTAAGTVYLHEFLGWDDTSAIPEWGQRIPVGSGDALAFYASEPATGAELWITDGTVAGTLPVTESLNPGSASTSPGALTRRGGQLLFSGNDPVLGRELFQIPITQLGGFVFETFGAGCVNFYGVTPKMIASGTPTLGGTIALAATGLPALQPAFLFYSTGTVPSPVDACTLLIESPASVLVATSSLYGKASLVFTIPASPALLGIGLFAQWVAPFGLTVVMSDAVEIQIGS